MWVELENGDSDSLDPDLFPQNEYDIVCNEGTEMSKKQEEAIHQQLSLTHHHKHIPWPTVDSESLNE